MSPDLALTVWVNIFISSFPDSQRRIVDMLTRMGYEIIKRNLIEWARDTPPFDDIDFNDLARYETLTSALTIALNCII